MNFNSIGEVLLVMLTVPFSLVGGVWLLYLLDYNLSVAVWVGLIALAGVATEIGVLMLTYLNAAWQRRLNDGLVAWSDLIEAVIEGAGQRVRPIIMTTCATIFGLLPIMLGGGTGADVLKRIAAPIVGGLLTAMVLSLVIIPVIYTIWKGWRIRRIDE